VAVYVDSARSTMIVDSNAAVETNAQKCNRGLLRSDLSSIVSGTHVQFIVGRRATMKSQATNLLASLSLSPSTHYYGTITSGGGSVNFEFVTLNIATGHNFPEQPLYDSTNTNVHGLQYPNMVGGGLVTDPVTGLQVAMVPSARNDMANSGPVALGTTAIDVTGGKWTNVQNCGTNNSSTCSSTGAGATDYLFVPLPNIANYSGWNPQYVVQDIVFYIYCSSPTTQQTLRVWLTRDSSQTADSGNFFSATCPVGSTSTTTMSDTTNGYPHPWFSQWAPSTKWIKPEVVPGAGSVTTSSTAVTRVSGDPFITSVPSGSKILINGSYYTISSFTDSSHLTLTGSAGTQSSPVAYRMAASGLRIANVTGTDNVTLSIGYNAATTTQPGYSTYNADKPTCNLNSTSITHDASGAPIPATPGYLCSDLEGSVYLYVPQNADGTARLEMRPLSRLTFTPGSHVDMNGDGANPFGNGTNVLFGGWDSTDPLTLYGWVAYYGGRPIVRAHYDTTISSDCANFKAYSSGPANGFSVGLINPDCFLYTVITPALSIPSKAGRSQVIAAYPTGINQLGQQVGAAHPIMGDVGWFLYFGDGSGLGVVGSAGCMPMFSETEGFSLNACFDLNTGVLKSLVDSFSTWPAIGGGSHGWNALAVGGLTWTEGGDPPVFDGYNPLIPFNRPFQAAVSQVNLAGFGSPPSWTSTTTLPSTTQLTCPPFTDPKVATYFGAYSGTNNCVQVRLSSPLCSHVPAPNASGGGYDFAGGKSESQAYPCSTPGFGVSSSSPDATGWSKLWDIFPGMWLWDMVGTPTTGDKYGENFVVAAAPTYNAANSIDVWLLRSVKAKYMVPRNGPTQTDPVCDDSGASYANHANGWTLSVFPPFACGFVGYWYDVNDPTAQMFWGNTQTGHGVIGNGSVANTFTAISYGNNGYYYEVPNQPAGADPNGFINAIPGTFIPTVVKFSNYSGTFNGSSIGGTQSYGNMTSATTVAGPNDRKFIDNRAINPTLGILAEVTSASGCFTPPGAAALPAPLAGTSQTYLLADATSTVAPTDPHKSTLTGWAGSHYLKDYSSPATGNVFGDAQSFGYCLAWQAGECRSGSSAGSAYVSVPLAESPNSCMQSDQNSMAVPGLFNLASIAGQTLQADPYAFDPNQLFARKLGFGLRAPGMQYSYQHTWGMPDGKAIMGRVDWADGVVSGLYLAGIPSWPNPSSSTSGDYQKYEISLGPGPSGSNARALLGYDEDGSTPSALYCASRKDACSTEATGSNPFAFIGTSGERTLEACAGGCTLTVPIIPGRVAYYQVQRLDASGVLVLSSGPITAVAAP
jgi:hypothetical protein